jgi:TolB-like protein/lipopolysaccharide biosynthesis regulator YciM
MRTRIIQGLSILLLILAVAWFIVRPDFEPVITAIAALVGLFSAEILKPDSTGGGVPVEYPVEGDESRPSIAVLPFEDFSPDPADSYFAHGMHEEIITQLQKIRGLAVRGRTSVSIYRDAPQPLPEIAGKLGVRYILEGSARKAGDQVRLTAQLIDARIDEHLWAENYDRPLSVENLFSVQTDIARQVAAALTTVLTPEDLQRVQSQPTENLEAYELYLRGRHLSQQYTRAGWTGAIEFYERAVVLDPGLAEAFAGMAYCFKELSHVEAISPDEGYAKAANAVAKAIELDETLGEAHATLGAVKTLKDWDMVGAETLFNRAVELSPDSPDVRMQYGSFLMWNGRFEEAIEQTHQALRLDPLAPLLNMWAGVQFFYARQHEESIRVFKGILDLDSSHVWAHMYLTHNYSMLGLNQEGLFHAEQVEEESRTTGDRSYLAYLGSDYPRLGKPERTEEILDLTLDLYAAKSIDAVTVAVMYSVLGRRDKAFEWLARAVDERSGVAVYIRVYGGTFLEDLASDPRFGDILNRIGFQA